MAAPSVGGGEFPCLRAPHQRLNKLRVARQQFLNRPRKPAAARAAGAAVVFGGGEGGGVWKKSPEHAVPASWGGGGCAGC